ncbi:immune-related, lectin-like receptor 4 isoform X2 [Osmerus eperlanus]|uniref:immune-related, lectin-like receptor 4 isoform X2 n=1 Tax=Osmerus eperlanus TaxID=29151 RepID=UPI002E10BD1B
MGSLLLCIVCSKGRYWCQTNMTSCPKSTNSFTNQHRTCIDKTECLSFSLTHHGCFCIGDTLSNCKDTTYAEINFNRGDQNQSSNAGNAASQQQVGSKVIPGGRNPVRVGLVVFGVLLMGAVITLVVVYTTIKSEHLQTEHLSNMNKTLIERNHTDGRKEPQCVPDWKYFGGKCYYFSSDMKTWAESRVACISSGGDLVIIESEDEQDFLTEEFVGKIKPDKPEEKFWIGLTDLETEGMWLWVDNSKLDKSFWLGKEPDNWNGTNNDQLEGEDCVRMGELTPIKNCWTDIFCSKPQRRICEST